MNQDSDIVASSYCSENLTFDALCFWHILWLKRGSKRICLCVLEDNVSGDVGTHLCFLEVLSPDLLDVFMRSCLFL
jgi:hypothetical protein